MTRVFPLKEGRCQVVVAGVGDGMVVTWEPHVKKLTTILKPRHYHHGVLTPYTPVSITHKLSGAMLQTAMVELVPGSVLIRMTDGAWRMLPHLNSDKMIDEDAKKPFKYRTLDCQVLEPELTQFCNQNQRAGAVEYRQWFQAYIESSVERQKFSLLSQHGAIKEKRQVFSQVNPNSRFLGEFLEWAKKDNPFYQMLLSFLNALGVMMEGIEGVPMSTLDTELSKVELGDDLALHVQII